MEMGDTSWGVIGGVLGALVTGVAAAILKIMEARHQQQKEVRIEALAEYKGLVDQFSARVNMLQAEVGKLYEAHTKCREENAELRGELRALRASRGRPRDDGEDRPATLAESQLVTDAEGVIIRVSPAALV